jgi:putative acetyltransferase
MSMQVRRARPDDNGRLLDLWQRSVRATHHFLEESDVLALHPLVAQELGSDAVQWWVLLSEGEALIGFLGFANDTIEALFIDPEHFGQGGGTFLVAHAQTLARATRLAVDVNEQNEAALGFYHSLGFSIAGRSPTDAGGRPFPILHLRRDAPYPPGAV